MKIYFEDNHIIVVEKKPNQPTQEDSSGDLDLLSEVREYIRVTYEKPGNVFVGLVHRLDRPVGGVMVFAKTSKAASRLSDQVRTRKLDKTYTAIATGYVEVARYHDYMVKNKKTNMSRTVAKDFPDAKHAELHILDAQFYPNENLSRVTIKLITGRSHQIRVQFASRNHALWGDARYNTTSKPGQQIALWATALTFEHPTTKERMTFNSHTPDTYPFTLR
ncbi:RluA family pseudouridine synthase [Erysipelothrix sp. HDW6C]|uniref:RluA family pseudouridine synthase n=1 Tax=Erysipelothrix sp. HDW6C TaxID=2714930 RepID=UPI00140842ED|nr:RluA family pseudouridine synthase [Erysipelothrix sp. HDW6C]QIK69673.1 RluA family pseudouridine synthase [Erysipelothrix sp. HDW6C]